MASTIQVDKVQDTGGNTILSSNSTGTFTYEAASGANFTALAADNVSAGTVAIARGGTGAATLAAAGLANTPAWKAGITSQSLTYNTATKIDYVTEITDTNSAYDTTNKRFTVPADMGGTYIIHAFYRTGTGTDINSFDIKVYKNGSALESAEEMDAYTMSYSYNTIQATGMVTLAASDYIEMYAKQADNNSTNTIGYSNEGRFWGYKLIGV